MQDGEIGGWNAQEEKMEPEGISACVKYGGPLGPALSTKRRAARIHSHPGEGACIHDSFN